MQSFREQFYIAIAQNNLDTIQQLYENKSITLYETNALAQPPTVVALEYSHNKIAFWLRCQYARDLFNKIKLIDARDSEDTMKCVREHLQYNPYLTVLDENRNSLLHLAVVRNDRNLVTFLLKLIHDNYEVEISGILNGKGQDCLELAIQSNNLEMALHIISFSSAEAISWDARRLLDVLALSRKLDESREDALLQQCIQQYSFPFSFNQSAIGNILHKLEERKDSEIIQLILHKARAIKVELIELLAGKGDIQLIPFILHQFPQLKEQTNSGKKYLFEIFADKEMWDMALLSIDQRIPFERIKEFLLNAITLRDRQDTSNGIFYAFIDRCVDIYGDDFSFHDVLCQALSSRNETIFNLIWEGLPPAGKGTCLIEAAEYLDWNMVLLLCENLPVCKSSFWYDQLLLKIINARNTGVDDALLLKCIHKLLQVGTPGDIRSSQGQNWIHIAAKKVDFKVMLAFPGYNLQHLKWFFEGDIKGFSPLEILVHSGQFSSMDKEFMRGCLSVIKAINNIPSVIQEKPRPSFFYDAKPNHVARARTRTRTLNQVFTAMEKAESLQNTCTRIPEVRLLDDKQQHLLKHDIPMLLLLSRRDIGSFFAFLPQAVTGLICFKAVYDYLGEAVKTSGLVMKDYHGLHPFYEKTYLVNDIKIPGQDAFLQFCAAYRSAHSRQGFGRVSNTDERFGKNCHLRGLDDICRKGQHF